MVYLFWVVGLVMYVDIGVGRFGKQISRNITRLINIHLNIQEFYRTSGYSEVGENGVNWLVG